VGALTASGTDWRGLWLASGLLAAVGAGVCLATLSGDARPHRDPPPAGTPSSQPSNRITSLVVAYGLFGFGYVITATFLVAVVRASPDRGTFETVTWLVVGVAAIFSVAGWGRVAGRVGARTAFGLACLVEGVGVLATAASSAAPAVLVGAALLGATFMAITALGLAGARRRSSDPGRAVAVMTAAFGVGQIVGPTFAGTILEATGSLTLPTVTAAGALAAAAILVWVGRRG
jgi:predicted MFS family arabinose efflux permease